MRARPVTLAAFALAALALAACSGGAPPPETPSMSEATSTPAPTAVAVAASEAAATPEATPTPTPEQACANGIAVADPEATRGLAADCVALLSSMDALRGDAPLDWDGGLASRTGRA